MVITNKIWKVDMGSYMRLMELFIKGNGEKESNYSIIKFILLDIIFNLIMFLLYWKKYSLSLGNMVRENLQISMGKLKNKNGDLVNKLVDELV